MPMNRRHILQLSGTGLGMALATACGVAPAIRVSRALTVWTIQYIIDDGLARWRRLHPEIAVTRIPVPADTFVSRLDAARAGGEPVPDVVVAPSDIVARFSQPGVWHALDDQQFTVAQLAPSGVAQCRCEDSRLLALPVAVNPLGVWYRSDILQHAGLPQQPETVATQIGTDWQQFLAFGMQIHANMPDVGWCADAMSDVFTPLTRTQTPLRTAAEFAFAVRSQHADFAATRNSGAWFDLLQRDRVAMVVAGSWMQATLGRTTRPGEFPWRVIAPPNGCIAGACLAIAVSEASNQRDDALRFMRDMVFDEETQLIVSDNQQLIPALTNTYTDSRFQRMEPFCAGQKIGQLWTHAAKTMAGHALSARWVQRNEDAHTVVANALGGGISYPDALQQLSDM